MPRSRIHEAFCDNAHLRSRGLTLIFNITNV
jgi:hypothetical protein